MTYADLTIDYRRAVATGDYKRQADILRHLIAVTDDEFALCELRNRLQALEPKLRSYKLFGFHLGGLRA